MTPISEAIETVIKHIDQCESEELRKELDLVLVKLIALLGKEKEFLFRFGNNFTNDKEFIIKTIEQIDEPGSLFSWVTD